MIRALASLLLAFGLAIAPEAAAWTSCANELPRAPLVVTFHPRSDTPFTIDQLRAALRAGANGAEFDLRWRAKDSAVVCAHDVRDVGRSPTLTDALDAILAVRGRSPSVLKDGLQFYVTLDLKESGAQYHRAIFDALRERADHWSMSARPGMAPRGITVVVSGMAAPLERVAALFGEIDDLCVVEGRNLDRRVLDLSDRDGPLGWVALQHPVTRERIRALHEGRDAQYHGRYNVRVYGAGRRHSDAIAAGADAVNADLEEIARVRKLGAARPKAAAGATTTATDWILQDWRVNSSARARFEAAWRARATARRARVKGWRGEVLLRSLDDAAIYRVVERWDGREWKRSSRAGAAALAAGGGKPISGSRMELTEVEDRLGTAPIAGDHVRIYRIRARPGTARSFHRAWRRANDAIRGAYPKALGSSLLRDPGQADALVEIVRWKSEAAWRRFIDAPPPDADADAAIRAAIGDLVTKRYEAIGIAR
ncbi:MAG TPA: antibiotic biosynthesis monooxygenase [Candidatus Eisenbacteria bacterium]|nr:antibiotic biosynthesis monooxygenase [Candidatus Eisenbacteria bacterium]